MDCTSLWFDNLINTSGGPLLAVLLVVTPSVKVDLVVSWWGWRCFITPLPPSLLTLWIWAAGNSGKMWLKTSWALVCRLSLASHGFSGKFRSLMLSCLSLFSIVSSHFWNPRVNDLPDTLDFSSDSVHIYCGHHYILMLQFSLLTLIYDCASYLLCFQYGSELNVCCKYQPGLSAGHCLLGCYAPCCWQEFVVLPGWRVTYFHCCCLLKVCWCRITLVCTIAMAYFSLMYVKLRSCHDLIALETALFSPPSHASMLPLSSHNRKFTQLVECDPTHHSIMWFLFGSIVVMFDNNTYSCFRLKERRLFMSFICFDCYCNHSWLNSCMCPRWSMALHTIQFSCGHTATGL